MKEEVTYKRDNNCKKRILKKKLENIVLVIKTTILENKLIIRIQNKKNRKTNINNYYFLGFKFWYIFYFQN